MHYILSRIYIKKQKNISLKLSPTDNYDYIFNNKEILKLISGITGSNAYISLPPPDPDINTTYSPFVRTKFWSPCGVYGPFEKNLTFNMLYKLRKHAKDNNLDISCVGGLVNGEDVVQALLLGATTVQLSSAILWKSNKVIAEVITFIKKYMEKHDYNFINEFRAKSLQYIINNTQDIDEYKFYYKKPEHQKQPPKINYDRCLKCMKCINSSCLALSSDENKNISINEELCSGCGFCVQKCPFKAIKI